MSVESERVLRASIAAHGRWAACDDPSAATAPARKGLNDRFLREAREKYGDLPEAELARRAEHLRKQFYKTLALKSAASRRRAAAARKSASALDAEADAAEVELGELGEAS